MPTFCAVVIAFVTATYVLFTLVSWELFGSTLITSGLAIASGFLLMWTIDLANNAARDKPP
jgi:hypothetical protein